MSDVVFFGNVFNLFHIPIWGPIGYIFHFSWGAQILFYFADVIMAIWQEPEERSILSILYIPILLFVYSKLWIVVIVNTVIKIIGDVFHHREAAWDKTVHTAEATHPEPSLQEKKQ